MEHERKNDTVTARITGELDHCSAQTIRRELDMMITEPGVRNLVRPSAAQSWPLRLSAGPR